mmetsp:Transcript_111440/g.322172  ORF Transcript_111440/g.322172 Transcript_111440/m.322172 type:complete len:325 (+) Transcript_111440:371-1345(+)
MLAERHGVHLALHKVKLRGAWEGLVAPRRQLCHGDKVFGADLRRFERLHVNLLIALLLHSEGACRQRALLVCHIMATAGEGKTVEVEHVRRLLLLIFGDLRTALAELAFVVHVVHAPLTRTPQLQLLHLLSKVAGDVPLAVPLLRGTVQLLEHRLCLGRLAHVLQHRSLVLLGLRLTQPGAVEDLQAVLEQQLRELKVLVLQDLHELVLALLQVLDRQDRKDLLLRGDALVRVVKDLAQLALQPMGIDLLDVDDVLALLLLLLFHVIFINSRHMNSSVVSVFVHLGLVVVIVIVIIVADLAEKIALLVVLVVLVKDNGYAGGII